MRAQTWDPDWPTAHCVHLSMKGAWRGVETQYIAASMKLVDTLEEQDLLERLLEASKPPTAPSTVHKHYFAVKSLSLLSTAQLAFSAWPAKRPVERGIHLGRCMF